MADNWKLLTTDETAQAAAVLSRAFYDDPLQHYFLPDPEERRHNATPVFQSLAAYGCLYGEVLTPASGVNGAAIWKTPGHWEMTEEGMAKTGVDRLAEHMGERAATRFAEIFGLLDGYHHRDAPMDHWYLSILGVDPPLQGQGIGKSLIRPILERADTSGLHCYLETAQPKNVPLYTGLGFKVIVDEVDPKSGVRLWTFLREPES